MTRRALAFTLLGILWACKEPDPHPPSITNPGSSVGPVGGGGGSSSGATDGGTLVDANTDAGLCTDLDTPTTVVDESGVSDTVTPGIGGDVTAIDGVYDLQTAQKFVGISGQAGPNGITYKEVIRITGGTALERVRITQDSGGPETTTNASYVLQASGTNILLTQKCPTQGTAETFTYTFQNGVLTLTSAASESFTYRAR